MNTKTFIGILGVIAILMLVLAGLRFLGGSKETVSLSEIGIDNIGPDSVNMIIIEKGKSRLELSNTDGLWSVDGYAVSDSRISAIWEVFGNLSISGPVSINKENHARFGVSNDDMSVVFREGDREQRIQIGNQATTFETTYVRNAERDDVYVAYANLRSVFSLEVDDWRDKTVVDVKTESVGAIEIENNGKGFRIEKDDDGSWSLVENGDTKKVNSEVVDRMLSGLSPLVARAFVSGSGASEFAGRNIDGLVRAYGPDGEIIFQINLIEEGDYWWARVSGNNTVYEIQKYRLSDVLIEQDKLSAYEEVTNMSE